VAASSDRQIIEKIVDVRGNLFHNSRKGPTRWSPEEQKEFRDETFFLSHLTYELAFKLASPKFSDGTLADFVAQAEKSEANFVLSATYRYTDANGTEGETRNEFRLTGVRPRNRQLRDVLVKAIELFDDRFPVHNLKQLGITDEQGALLCNLTIAT
jgi:hypothetical protein